MIHQMTASLLHLTARVASDAHSAIVATPRPDDVDATRVAASILQIILAQ
jgi:hypothetical protein